ncbi:transcription termination/antitermination protein NusA [Mycoplasmopsis agalactiae]|uniref:transcription termination/antitermination protein NusA n=1 Tax=Mycoplasmopsis agalactiae TaxID=2110 RepID=UPI001C6F167B|nr:transcription termination/antitermination protein NusA [Mycoplasmopsis agalactiae]QYR08844.1 transcription termination/antitermination protein NusA [Mycoplasmopsis agalactiae]
MSVKKNSELMNAPKIWYEIIKGYNEKEKLELSVLADIFSEEVTRIVQKNIDPEANIVFEIDEENKEVHVYNTEAIVVDDSEFDDLSEADKVSLMLYNVPLSVAKKVKNDANVDDTIKIEIDLLALSKSTNPVVQKTPKIIESSILQAIKKLQKSIVYTKYLEKIGETVKVTFISKNSKGSWNVQIVDDGVIAHLPANYVSAKRVINPGSYGDVVIERVEKDTKLSQITVSLDSPKLIEKILYNNIPEISSGLIEIVNVQRIPGERTKAVFKASAGNEHLDVYGAIIGQDSSRINLIISEMNQGVNQADKEKFDVIVYTSDKKEFIRRCMLPGQVVDIVPKNESQNSFYVITIKAGLSAAIGKKGANTMLASKVSHSNLDIITVEEAKQKNIPFDESKIAEVEESLNSFRRYGATKKAPTRAFNNNRRKTNSYFENLDLSLEGFDKDILAFREQEQAFFDESNSQNMEFDELIQQYNSESVKENIESDERSIDEKLNEIQREEKLTANDYKKAKEVAKNFKVDKDLSSFGLDGGIDLSDIENEEW